jgi:PIN domain nuclease of toxin-antitoxin system
MNYLLDTHVLLWAFFDTEKLTNNVRQILSDNEDRILISAVSFWEISIKVNTGKLRLGSTTPNMLPGICERAGFEVIDLNAWDASSFFKLTASYHKDPFDRMLIWQALSNRYALISDDDNIRKYAFDGLEVVW